MSRSSSPEWLSGSFQSAGLSMSYNRLSLIAFAFFVIIATWALLNKTSWGLHVRATMQNRRMASSLGIKSTRVNMMTFAYGSGLGRTGRRLPLPDRKRRTIPWAKPTSSTASWSWSSAEWATSSEPRFPHLGIGSHRPGSSSLFLGPVMGKITVLLAIILFLQLQAPAGMFPARTRSLDD